MRVALDHDVLLTPVAHMLVMLSHDALRRYATRAARGLRVRRLIMRGDAPQAQLSSRPSPRPRKSTAASPPTSKALTASRPCNDADHSAGPPRRASRDSTRDRGTLWLHRALPVW